MKIHINIAEDVELRAFIKEQIRGAVKAITREEILKEIASEIARKTNGIPAMLTEALRAEIKSKVTSSTWSRSELEMIYRDEIRKGLKDHFAKL